MLAATSLTAGAQAQQMVVNKAKAFDVAANAKKVAVKPTNLKAVQSFSTPSRSIEDGVYYARPRGVYYSGYKFGDSGTPAWLVPGLAPVTYYNKCTPADQAVWSIAYNNGEVEDLNEYTDVDNNLKYKWGINPYSDPQSIIIGMSAPTIMQGNSSFTAPFMQAVATDVTPQVNYNIANEGVYALGFGNGPGFGSGSVLEQSLLSDEKAGIAKIHGTMEVYEKPLSPMYVESFQLPFVSFQENPLNGKELTMKIYGIDAEGYVDREAKEVLVCNSCEIVGNATSQSGEPFWYGDVTFSKLTQNEFGDEVTLPFVIDYDYAIEISGYNQEGVDVQFYVIEVTDSYDMVNDAPTRFSCELNDGSFTYYYFGNQSVRYKTEIITNVFYDGVELLEPYKSLVVSDDGQTCLTDNPNMGEDKKVNFVPFSSAAPFFAYDENGEVVGQNYDVEGLPEWLGVDGVTDEPREQGGYSAIFFKAEPLPAGTEGRYATIYIVGRGGVKNAQPITVRQGSVTGIDTVIAEGDANAIYYNVSGQRVNNAKGLVISKTGKRIIK